MGIAERSVGRAGLVVSALALACAAARGGEGAFEPAFGAGDIDFAASAQFAGGERSPVDAAAVKRTLGLEDADGNWETPRWTLGEAKGGKETVFAALLVLKRAATVGTVGVSYADLDPGKFEGSRTSGEVWYRKPGRRGRPDPNDGSQWAKLDLGGPQPFVRHAGLPPGTATDAFLYRDTRVGGAASIMYWRFYKRRLFNAASTAAGFASHSKPGAEPGNVLAGGSWSCGPRPGPISEKAPVTFTVAWDAPQALAGLFLYSNASKYRVLSYRGPDGVPPALAGPEHWKEAPFRPELDNLHDFPHWAYSYRWLGLGGLRARAVRLEILGVHKGGSEVWISGLGAFTDLGDARAPEVAAKDDAPPFRVGCDLPTDGEVAIAVDRADGTRVRTLAVQVPRKAGATREPWDLKDDAGRYVEPGRYRLSGIVGPAPELRFGICPYPNVNTLWPDRTPWLTGHSGPNGWLSDHSQNWACAASGDRLYFAACMAEAGVALIECDLDGKKLWGRHDFGPWTGVNQMAADEESLFVLDGAQKVHRIELRTREEKIAFSPDRGAGRRGWRSAMAARGGKVVFAYTGQPLFDNAATSGAVDLDRCVPKPAGRDVLRLLRIEGDPPGKDVDPRSDKPQGNGRLYLESAAPGGEGPEIDGVRLEDPETKRVAVIAFGEAVPLGSVVFPWPAGEGRLELAALKPGAPYPPRADRDGDWTAFESSGGPGWNCVPAPPGTMTRALRIVFRPRGEKSGFWRLDGMKLLNRRFRNASAEAKVRVSSGKVSATGEWDAERTEAVAPDRPGIYLVEWTKPRKLCGLAIKEIDGAVAEIDVWQGAGKAALEGAACAKKEKGGGWRNVATYRQKRRTTNYNDRNNRFACYMDGYVDFNETVETRAVRVRVTEQWLDNGPDGDQCRRHDGRSEHGMHFRQSHCVKLDTRICRVMGVAALESLGGNPKTDEVVYERLEIWDGKTGKLDRELPVRPGWHGLSFAPDGELYVIQKDHEIISRVDTATGRLTPVITDSHPSAFTIGPDGLFYVWSWANDCRVPIRVYDSRGRKVREIGKPGGLRAGLWDPERFGQVHRMCVDEKGGLWVLEAQDNPRRIVHYRTDGTFVKEILGNTHYGGGGTLDRTDSSRAFHGGVEFEIDWRRHRSRIRAYWGKDFLGGDPVVREVDGRRYVVTAPLSLNDRQGVGTVYLYDEKAGAVRLAAAMGEAERFSPLRRAEVISKLKGETPGPYEFLWFDRDGDAQVDAEEIDFRKKKGGSAAVGTFDERLGCTGNGVLYEVARVLASGVPEYRRVPVPGHPHLRLADGNFLTLHGSPEPGSGSENFVTDPRGRKLWGYPAHGGVSGLSIPSWRPGLASNEFGVIGHEVADARGLGEFVVVHANTGQWKIWTADGLLAGQVLLHKTDPRSRFFSGFDEARPGMRLDPLTASQEHFHGFFTKAGPEGKYYVVAGFTHMSVIEVAGLDRFRRFGADVTVMAKDIALAREWEKERARKAVASKALVIEARRAERTPDLDGDAAPHEWGGNEGARLADVDARLRIAFDDSRLYLCYDGKGLGEIANSGDDFRRYFKTGACLDFLIGVDPKAPHGRTRPARGDVRLLFTFVGDAPKAVLYAPVWPGARAAEGWRTRTEAAGETAFDRVVLLDNVEMKKRRAGDRTTVEIALPLAAMGLRVAAGALHRMDWGVLTSPDGRQVKQRAYWANVTATGTSDEATEARLEPGLWGHVRFAAPAGLE